MIDKECENKILWGLLISRNKEIEGILVNLCEKDYSWALSLHKKFIEGDKEIWASEKR